MNESQQGTTAEPRRPDVRVPPGFYFFGGLGLGVGVDRVTGLAYSIDNWASARVGAISFAIGCTIVLVGGASLWLAGTPVDPTKPARSLVTWGPYRLSRNPIYVGLSLGYLGAALLVGSVSALALLPGILLLFHGYVIPREERYLAGVFGEAYAEYLKAVRRWV